MKAQLGNKDGIFSRAVNNAVLIVDAAGPVTGKAVFEWFGLARTREGSRMISWINRFTRLSMFLSVFCQ
jgi:hypothetical protein